MNDLQPVALHLGERRQGSRSRAEPRHRRVQLVVAAPRESWRARTRCPRASRTAAGPPTCGVSLPAAPSRTRTTPPGSTTRTISSSASRHRGYQVQHPTKVGGAERLVAERQARRVRLHERERRAALRLLPQLGQHRRRRDPSPRPGCRLRAAAGRPVRSRRRPRPRDRDRASSPASSSVWRRRRRPSSAAGAVVVLRGAIERDGVVALRSRLRRVLVRIHERERRDGRRPRALRRIGTSSSVPPPCARTAPTRTRRCAPDAATTRPR